jgi:hypothetical protein
LRSTGSDASLVRRRGSLNSLGCMFPRHCKVSLATFLPWCLR